jgi:hypothetical protein
LESKLQVIDYAEIPQDAKDYYAALDHEVIAEVYCNDEVLSQIKLHKFVSTSKGKGRKRHRVKEVTLSNMAITIITLTASTGGSLVWNY